MSMLKSPEYFRARADELRQAATASMPDDSRETLIFLAEQFDVMAEEAASADRVIPPAGK